MATAKKTTVKTEVNPQATKKERVKNISKLHKEETFELLSDDDVVLETFVFQYPGTREAERIISKYLSSKDKVEFYEGIMQSVIVSPPGIDFEYWDDKEGYQEVMSAADRFLADLHFN